jgi:hypothetical protein
MPLVAIAPVAVSTVTRYVGGSPKSLTTEYSVVPPHPNAAAFMPAPPVVFGEPLSRTSGLTLPFPGSTVHRWP